MRRCGGSTPLTSRCRAPRRRRCPGPEPPRSSGARRLSAFEAPDLPGGARRVPGGRGVAGAGAAGGRAAPVAPAAADAGTGGAGLRGLGPGRDRRTPVELRPGADRGGRPARPAAAGGAAVLRRGTGVRGARVRGGPEGTQAVSYTVAAGLAVLGALALDLLVLRTRLVAGRQVVRYDPHAILGLRLAYAPVEDLGFGYALVLVTLSVWVRLGRRGVDGSTTPPGR